MGKESIVSCLFGGFLWIYFKVYFLINLNSTTLFTAYSSYILCLMVYLGYIYSIYCMIFIPDHFLKILRILLPASVFHLRKVEPYSLQVCTQKSDHIFFFVLLILEINTNL